MGKLSDTWIGHAAERQQENRPAIFPNGARDGEGKLAGSRNDSESGSRRVHKSPESASAASRGGMQIGRFRSDWMNRVISSTSGTCAQCSAASDARLASEPVPKKIARNADR